jgi:hypothetical protein
MVSMIDDTASLINDTVSIGASSQYTGGSSFIIDDRRETRACQGIFRK